MKWILIFFWALVVPVMASPQTSDADLKIATVPPINTGASPNFHGLRVVVGDRTNMGNSCFTGCNASQLDFSGFVVGGQFQNFDANPGTTFLNLSVMYDAIASNSSGITDFSGDGFTDLTSFLGAFNSASASSIGLILDDNPVNGLLGSSIVSSQGGNSISIQNCGLTSCPVIDLSSGFPGTIVNLSHNNFTSVDLSNVAQFVEFGSLAFSSCGVTTVTPGDGISTGIINLQLGGLFLDGNALNNANEDSLLAALVALETNIPGQSANVNISGGTNAVPDVTGAADISILVGAGWIFTTN